MGKKKAKGPKGTKVTLKMAKKAIRVTPDGFHRLSLSNMGITIFPKCILKLTYVDELDLSRNMIQKLPDTIAAFETLKWLDLHSNWLESVPKSLGKLSSLTHLNLSNNRITSAGLPSELSSLGRLKSLNLGMNRLDTLPPSWVVLNNLQELGLFDNLFVTVPEIVKVYPNLKKLNVKRNPCSHGDGEDGLRDQKEGKDMFLVHDSILCRTCLKRCQEQREEEEGKCHGGKTREEDDSDMSDKKKLKTFSALTTPNSVAIVSQDVWRMKQNAK